MNYHQIAENRSAVNPGELIYVWLDGSQYTETQAVANEAEMQFNSVRDSQILAVYRDGESID